MAVGGPALVIACTRRHTHLHTRPYTRRTRARAPHTPYERARSSCLYVRVDRQVPHGSSASRPFLSICVVVQLHNVIRNLQSQRRVVTVCGGRGHAVTVLQSRPLQA